MSYLQILFFSLIQAITELIPVSSSMHVNILYDYFHIYETGYTLKVIQGLCDIGSISAIMIFYKQYFYFNKQNFKLIQKILIAIFPISLCDRISHFYIHKDIFYKYSNIIFIIFSIIYLIIDLKMKNTDKRNIFDVNYKNFFIVGIAQVLAMFSGVSRLGITYSTLRLLKFNRKTSLTASFLLGLLTNGVATFVVVTRIDSLVPSLLLLPLLTAIFTIPFIYIIFKYIEKNGIWVFCIYRVFLGILLLLQK